MLKRFSLVFTLGSRNVLRNPRRSILTLFAVVVGILSSILLAALARGMGERIIEDAVNQLTGHVQLHSPGYLDDPTIEHSMSAPGPEVLQVLARPDVKNWSMRVRVPGVILSERESFGVTIVGIDPKREKELSFIGNAVLKGRYLESLSEGGILIGERLADYLQTDLGKRVVLMSQNTEKEVGDRGFRIVGLFRADLEATEKAYVFVALETAQKMLGLDGGVSEIAILAEDREKIDGILKALRSQMDGLDVKSWKELQPFIVSMVELQGQFLIFWYVIVVIAIAFGLVNTLFMAVYERIREIGLYQALGMHNGLVLLEVLCESVVLLVIGAMAGNLLSWGGLLLLSGGIDLSRFAAGTEFFGMGSYIYPLFLAKDAVIVNVLVLAIGMLASFYPAWRASRLVPVDAITRT